MSFLKKHNRSKKHTSEIDLDHVNEEHVQAFARALAEDPNEDSTEHISAMTDFMPIKQKIKTRQNVPNAFEGFTYHIIRFPLMVMTIRQAPVYIYI